jgi:hypothetical protein
MKAEEKSSAFLFATVASRDRRKFQLDIIFSQAYIQSEQEHKFKRKDGTK